MVIIGWYVIVCFEIIVLGKFSYVGFDVKGGIFVVCELVYWIIEIEVMILDDCIFLVNDVILG